MSLRIARIETLLYRAEVTEPVKTSFGSIPRRSVLLLRVEDAEGGHGWGEVWCNFPPFGADNKMRLFETVIAPAALSGTYRDASDAWHTLTAKTARWAIQGGEPGPFAACIAGLDLALWDLTARRAGKPLRALLAGDHVRNQVPTYASGLNPDTALETVARCRAAGFSGVQSQGGFRRGDRHASRLGPVGGPSIGRTPDGRRQSGMGPGRGPPGCAVLGRIRSGFHRRADPRRSPGRGVGGTRDAVTGAAGGWGERVRFRELRHADQQRPPRGRTARHAEMGGVTGAYVVGRRAVAAGRSYCPHWLGSGIGLLAAAQVLAAAGGPGLLEHDVMENPLREALALPFPKVQNGVLPLPTEPGLGVEPDMQAAAGWLVTKAEYRA